MNLSGGFHLIDDLRGTRRPIDSVVPWLRIKLAICFVSFHETAPLAQSPGGYDAGRHGGEQADQDKAQWALPVCPGRHALSAC